MTKQWRDLTGTASMSQDSQLQPVQEELHRDLRQIDEDGQDAVYKAKWASARRLQAMDRDDDEIGRLLGITIKPPHRRRITVGSSSRFSIAVDWGKAGAPGLRDVGAIEGKIALSVAGRPVGGDGPPTWAFFGQDVLGWLTKSWPALVLGDDQWSQESPAPHPVHDLKRVFQTTTVSSLWIYSTGDLAQFLIDDWEHEEDLDYVISILEDLGGLIASRISWLGLSQFRQHVDAWNARTSLDVDIALQAATGIAPVREVFAWLREQVSEVGDYFRSECYGRIRHNPIVAIARMTNTLADFEIRRLIEECKQFPHVRREKENEYLKLLGEEASRELANAHIEAEPYQQGYLLARWLRNHLNFSELYSVDPAQVLRRFGVSIYESALEIDEIDALGVWREGDNPVVLINLSGRHSRVPGGRRASLAHELCHILVDRKRALPVAEVLGGQIPWSVEARANAFAAELLLPLEAAREAVSMYGGASDEAVQRLMQNYTVSKTMAANQILNAKTPLSEVQRRLLLEWAHRRTHEQRRLRTKGNPGLQIGSDPPS